MPHQCTNCDRTFADGSTEMLSGCPECGGTKFQFCPDGFDDADDAGNAGSAPDSATDAAGDGSGAPEPPDPPDRPGDGVTRAVGSAAATVRDLVSGDASADATTAAPPSTADPAVQTDDGSDDDIIVAESTPSDENNAQADARSAVVAPDEVPESDGFDPAADGASAGPETDFGVDVIDPGEDAGQDEADSGEPGDPADAADPTDAAQPTDADDADTGTDSGRDGAAAAGESVDGSDAVNASESDRTIADEPDAERADRPSLAELREELNEQFESIRVVEPGQYELNLMELYDREEYIIALQEDGRYSIQMPETWREADA